MCGSDESESVVERRNPSRRAFIAYSAGVAALAVGLPEWPRRVLAAPSRILTADGTLPVSMAMHIHSAFSEQDGSMQGHLHQAQQNAVDVIWWTDHDYRMSGLTYRKTVHFTSLTAEKPAAGEGRPWQWQLQRSGELSAASTGGIVTNPSSPLDPVAGGSLEVSAHSDNASAATLGFSADANQADWNYHCSLLGQTLSIEVMPTSIGSSAYLELLVTSSYHPASGGRLAGNYVLSYRFGGSGAPGTRSVSGLNGVVNVAVTQGQWNSIAVTPATDIAALWPDMDSRDFGLYGLNLSAVSDAGAASGNFDYLRFTRSSGEVQLATQPEMMAAYAVSFPGVQQFQAMEISLTVPHINWFGSGVVLTDYGTITGGKQPEYQAFLQDTIVPQIHAAGGLVSYNHPYGVSAGKALPTSTQDQKMAALAAAMLVDNALGSDILEVGYPLRAGVDLAHHVGLWDVLSQRAVPHRQRADRRPRRHQLAALRQQLVHLGMGGEQRGIVPAPGAQCGAFVVWLTSLVPRRAGHARRRVGSDGLGVHLHAEHTPTAGDRNGSSDQRRPGGDARCCRLRGNVGTDAEHRAGRELQHRRPCVRIGVLAGRQFRVVLRPHPGAGFHRHGCRTFQPGMAAARDASRWDSRPEGGLARAWSRRVRSRR